MSWQLSLNSNKALEGYIQFQNLIPSMIIADSEIEVFGESTSHTVYLMKVTVDRIK